MNDKELNEMVGPIAEKYGFERASAEFTAYSDFKVRWTRSYTWIDMTVSDYIREAPKTVVADVIEFLIKRIKDIEAESELELFCSTWVPIEQKFSSGGDCVP